MSKKTHGNQKINQVLDDIFRNYHFISKMVKALELMRDDPRNESNVVYEKILQSLKKEYADFYKKSKKRLEEIKNPSDKIIDELADEFNIDSETIMLKLESGDLSDVLGGFPVRDYTRSFDLCNVEDRYVTDIYDSDNAPYPTILDSSRYSKIGAYPISLNIHRFASKRDVMDYLDKNWANIRELQSKYQPKAKKIRQRKYSREFEDYVWKNRSLSSIELINLLEKNFPDELKNVNFSFMELSYLKDEEKKRRSSDLT